MKKQFRITWAFTRFMESVMEAKDEDDAMINFWHDQPLEENYISDNDVEILKCEEVPALKDKPAAVPGEVRLESGELNMMPGPGHREVIE